MEYVVVALNYSPLSQLTLLPSLVQVDGGEGGMTSDR